MATSAYIVRKKRKGYEGVLCQYEGHPTHAGAILRENYKGRTLARLLSLGDILSLGPFIGEQHDVWDRNHYGATTFYARDGGDLFCGPRHFDSLEELFEWLKGTLIEYVYVYDGDWSYAEPIHYLPGQTEQEWTDLESLTTLFEFVPTS